ncbi:MAG: hypothetical protein QW774_01080 [Candidatus Micrarchaeaceae archaeon]
MKCSYCSREIEKGRGIIFVRRTGAVRHYCSRRCMRYDQMKRKVSPKEFESKR